MSPGRFTFATRGQGLFVNGSGGFLEAVRRIEGNVGLDRVVEPMERLGRPLGHGQPRSVLSGEWLGHAFHPLLTDYPLGCWTSAMLLDFLGGSGSRKASRRLVGLGVLAALPTAAAGLSDWLSVDRPSKRVGVTHAAANTVALGLYTASYLARRRQHHLRGMALGVLGGVAAVVGGYLGGHLSLTAAVTRDNALMPQRTEADRQPEPSGLV